MTTTVDRFTGRLEPLVNDGYGSSLMVSQGTAFKATRRFLTTNNTATGARDMNVNGTLAVPVRFTIGPPAGQIWGVAVIALSISDNAPFNQTDFGAIPGPLANGLYAGFTQDGADIDIYSGFRIKQNSDFIGIPCHVQMTQWAGTSQTLEARFAGYEDTGQFSVLNGDRQETIFLQVQDNLTTLVGMKAVARYVLLKE